MPQHRERASKELRVGHDRGDKGGASRASVDKYQRSNTLGAAPTFPSWKQSGNACVSPFLRGHL
jgi:hypothetical protein